MNSLKMFAETDLKEVEYYMYSTPFLTKEFCDYIVNKCNRLNTWGSAIEEHGYNTQDIYLEKELPEIYHTINSSLKALVLSKLIDILGLNEVPEPYTMFAIKYSMDSQRSLKLHHDESYITGSIKLNDDYEGAELDFPEQEYTNKDLGVGDLLLWPASLTHKHKSNELLKGEKYSLTIWTEFPRIDPDINLNLRNRGEL
jgi:hypothetical protein